MQLSPDDFNAFLGDIGQTIKWRMAHDCPCRDHNSGAAFYGCPHCHGSGTVWGNSIASVVGVSGQQIQRSWAQFGQWESGDIVVTVGSNQPAWDMGEFDRVQFSDSSAPFSTHLIHDGIQNIPFVIQSVLRVSWHSGSDVIVLSGDELPEVGANGRLAWGDNQPPSGATYSVTGRRVPEYFCWGSFPTDRAHHKGADLPRKVVLRRFDLFGRGG